MIKNGAKDWNRGFAGACEGDHVDIVDMLLNKGADDLKTGLCMACLFGQISIVKYLIKFVMTDWCNYFSSACKGMCKIKNQPDYIYIEIMKIMKGCGVKFCYNCYKSPDEHFDSTR